MADDIEQLLLVMEDARLEGNAAALARLGADLAQRLGVSEAGGDAYGLWLRFEVDGASQRMRWSWPGRFVMGSPDDEAGRRDDEVMHEVVLTRGLWLGETPVTRALYRAVTDESPGRRGGEHHPVVQVSFDDCARFCSLLAQRFPRLRLRLPTETQWEYAARAGSTTATYAGDLATDADGQAPPLDRIAWYHHNSRGGAHRTGQLRPNAWGYADMLGNVWEWCCDRTDHGASNAGQRHDPVGTTGVLRVIRGGSWSDGPLSVRAAHRLGCMPDVRSPSIGFRLAAALAPEDVAPGRGHGASCSDRHVAIIGGTPFARAVMAERLTAFAPGGAVTSDSAQVRCAQTEHGEWFVWMLPRGPQPLTATSRSWDLRDLRDLRAVAWCDVVLVDVCVERGLTADDLDWLSLTHEVLGENLQRVIFVLHGYEDQELIAVARIEAEEAIASWRAELDPALEVACEVRVVPGEVSWEAIAESIEAITPRRAEQGAVFAVDTVRATSGSGARVRGVLVTGTLFEGSRLDGHGHPVGVAAVSPVLGPDRSRAASAYLELTLEGGRLEEIGELSVLWAPPCRIALTRRSTTSRELLERELDVRVARFRSSTRVEVDEIARDTFRIVYRMDPVRRQFDLHCTVELRAGASSIELSDFWSVSARLDRLDEHTPGGQPLRPQDLCAVGGRWDDRESREDRYRAERLWVLRHHDRGIVELVQAFYEIGQLFGYTDVPVLTAGGAPDPDFWRRRGWRPRGPESWVPPPELFDVDICYIGNME